MRTGTGVRVGLTRVADVADMRRRKKGLRLHPGRLLYRGTDVLDLVNGKKGSHFWV